MLTVREVANRLRVSVQTVQRWIVVGYRGQKLQAMRPGNNYKITEEYLQDFLHRIDPETWRQAAEQDEDDRRQGKKDQEALARKVGW